MRIAIVSTPRVGNTWIRHLMGTAYQIPHMARHSMSAEDWASLPSEVVLQMHWRRDAELQSRLAEHGFRVLTIARHPLDVLISILHFCVYDSESEQWLLGRGGTEEGIWGAMPRSRSFIEYANGPRASELLSVTPDWWDQPNVVGVKYEDFVQDTEAQLRRVEAAFGPFRATSVHEVIEKNTMGQLRQGTRNNHYWKGQPGLWRQLLPAAETAELVAKLGPLLTKFGYDGTADPALDNRTADATWIQLVGSEVKQTIRKLMETHRQELHAKDTTINAAFVSLADKDAHIADVTARAVLVEERLKALDARVNASLVLGGPVGRFFKKIINRVRGRK